MLSWVLFIYLFTFSAGKDLTFQYRLAVVVVRNRLRTFFHTWNVHFIERERERKWMFAYIKWKKNSIKCHPALKFRDVNFQFFSEGGGQTDSIIIRLCCVNMNLYVLAVKYSTQKTQKKYKKNLDICTEEIIVDLNANDQMEKTKRVRERERREKYYGNCNFAAWKRCGTLKI